MTTTDEHTWRFQNRSMTKRESFAMHIFASLCVEGFCPGHHVQGARRAILLADVLLEELQRTHDEVLALYQKEREAQASEEEGESDEQSF